MEAERRHGGVRSRPSAQPCGSRLQRRRREIFFFDCYGFWFWVAGVLVSGCWGFGWMGFGSGCWGFGVGLLGRWWVAGVGWVGFGWLTAVRGGDC
jgi:hypothetical protein